MLDEVNAMRKSYDPEYEPRPIPKDLK